MELEFRSAKTNQHQRGIALAQSSVGDLSWSSLVRGASAAAFTAQNSTEHTTQHSILLYSVRVITSSRAIIEQGAAL